MCRILLNESAAATGYVPPEWQQLLLPTRTEASGGKPAAGQPSIIATAEQDVWQFGVLSFELCAGQELFPKDLNDDIITTASDRIALSSWCEPSPEQLDLVFKPALHIGSVSPSERLVAQDLIALCLRGNSQTLGGGHPCPTDRPSMATILEHPFFDKIIPPLPVIPAHSGLTDVCIRSAVHVAALLLSVVIAAAVLEAILFAAAVLAVVAAVAVIAVVAVAATRVLT